MALMKGLPFTGRTSLLLRKLRDFGPKVECSIAFLHHRSHKKTFRCAELCQSINRKPKTIPVDDSLKFGHAMTDHMLEVHWTEARGWGVPSIEAYHPLMLDPAAKCLHYSIELFEGMKAYYGHDGKIRLFRPTSNFARMNASAQKVCLPTFDTEELRLCMHKFVEVEKDWVPRAEGCSLYLRPTMIGTEPTLGVQPGNEALLYVIASPVGPYFPTGMKPVSLLADPQFVRAWPGGAGNSKLGANYAPTLAVHQIAQERGCQQVLWLFGEDRTITEAGTMNVFVHLINEDGENELVTCSLDAGIILPGVVRQSALELARSWGDVKVTERPITMDEVVYAQKQGKLLEMFGTGTACVVCPVERIVYQGEDISVPTMETANPIYSRLYSELTDIFYGRRKSAWSEVVCDA